MSVAKIELTLQNGGKNDETRLIWDKWSEINGCEAFTNAGFNMLLLSQLLPQIFLTIN